MILSNLCTYFNEMRHSQQEGSESSDELRQRVEAEYPVPEHLDYRVRYKIGKDKIEK